MLSARMTSIGTLRVGKAACVPAPESLTLHRLAVPSEINLPSQTSRRVGVSDNRGSSKDLGHARDAGDCASMSNNGVGILDGASVANGSCYGRLKRIGRSAYSAASHCDRLSFGAPRKS